MSGAIEIDSRHILRGEGDVKLAVVLPSGYIVAMAELADPCCGARDPIEGLCCSRLPDHRGRHVACEIDDEDPDESRHSGHILATWRQT